MRKIMYKSVLAVIAAGLLSVGMATAETVDTPDTTNQSVFTNTLKLGHNFKNVEPRTDSLQWHFHEWPVENTQKAHTFKGNLIEAAQLIRSITWTKDGMAYSLLFLEPVKAVDAEFYKEHVEPVKI